MFFKAVILIGGPQKGTRFRPLSFDVPKPLFPVAGVPTLQHLIEACSKVPNMQEILLIGFYQADAALNDFASNMVNEYKINIRYLQEYTELGTAGGIYHFRDQIRRGDPEAFFLINGDVCGDFPLNEMVEFHVNNKEALITMLGTEATRPQSQQYGCIVENEVTHMNNCSTLSDLALAAVNKHRVRHYVEKPSTFVSTIINCGVYLCSLNIFNYLADCFKNGNGNQGYYPRNDVSFGFSGRENEYISLEQDILTKVAGLGNLFVYNTTTWWSQIKTAGSAIYANRHYLELYRKTHPERLAKNVTGGPKIVGDVFIHRTAKIHPSATLGPNVSIGSNAVIGSGVRIRESIILKNSTIQDHALVLHSIVGWNSKVGPWARIEGTPCDPNPNKPFAKMENVPLFNNGHLNPSITVLGYNVQVARELLVLNCIVLPHKTLCQSYKNEIIL